MLLLAYSLDTLLTVQIVGIFLTLLIFSIISYKIEKKLDKYLKDKNDE